MRTVVITPPAPIVTWEEADRQLELDGDADRRTQVEAMIAAATAMIDGPTGWLGRALGEQVLEARFNYFPCIEIDLGYPEVIAVQSVKYYDPAGVEHTLDPAAYEIAGRIVAPIWGTSWPAVNHSREGVRFRYTAGSSAAQLAIAKAAILLMVGDLFRFRETATESSKTSAIPMSTTVENVLAPLRVYA